MTRFILFCLAGAVALVHIAASADAASLKDYRLPGALEPMPDGVASLYRAPWRDNLRTVSAYDALQGIGVYYKHMPHWTAEQNTQVMTQMAAAGVKRLRLAPHHAMYIDATWSSPSSNELSTLQSELTACRRSGIRPCVTFVHIPAMGKGDEMSRWMKRDWNKGLMPLGAGPGSPEQQAYFEKVYLALEFILRAARDAGFADQGSYDLEMGQNLWWGAPALPPFPGLTLDMLKPGGQVHEFDKALMERARKDGYREPLFWDSECHHEFDRMADDQIPEPAVGRAISFYSPYAGITTNGFVGSDDWPARQPLRFAEGQPPEIILCKPEGFMADFSRHDNLIALIRASRKPVAVPSLGVVPGDIPNLKECGMDGWELKSRGLCRSYAFWLNQGVPFVLIHSAYEGANDVNSHALLPEIKNTTNFTWQSSRPLTALHAFVQGLDGAKALSPGTLVPLRFQYALSIDPILIPASSTNTPPMRAGDLVTLLPFQVDARTFTVAAYVVTPTLTVPMATTVMTLRIDKAIKGGVAVLDPVNQLAGQADILERGPDFTVIRLEINDCMKWVRFRVR